MDLGIVGSIATYLAGVASAAGIAWMQQRAVTSARREEREVETRTRREERDELHQQAEIDRVRGLYKRVAQLGMEYRWIEGIGVNQWEHWKLFMPRFHEIKAELEFDGSPEVRAGFESYVDHVQMSQAEDDQHGYVAEYWEHADRAMGELAALMRKDLHVRISPNTARALPAASDARALPPGDPIKP